MIRPERLSRYRPQVDVAILSSVDLFRDLNAEQLRAVAVVGVERPYDAKQVIFREGESGDEIFVVCWGSVRISKIIPGMGEEAMAVLEPGASVGEMMLVERKTPIRSADAIAHTSCILGAIPRDAFHALLDARPDISALVYRNLAATLAVRLRETNERFRALFAMSARW